MQILSKKNRRYSAAVDGALSCASFGGWDGASFGAASRRL